MDYMELLSGLNRAMQAHLKSDKEIRQLEADCLTLALRLYSEDPDSFGPETREVMARWTPKIQALLRNPYATIKG